MKKMFGRVSMYAAAALCAWLFCGCNEEGIDSQPEGPANFQIDALDAYTFEAESPEQVVFNISSNTPWRIESDQQWCHVTPTMSATSSLIEEITVTVDENIAFHPRTAVLTISANSIETAKKVAITQESKTDLVVTVPSEPIPAEGGTVAIIVRSNKPWEYITEDAFLHGASPASGEGTGEETTVMITVPANTGITREGSFTIRTALEESKNTLTQDGMVLRVDKENEALTFDWQEMSKVITVDANIPWTVSVDEAYSEWLSAEKGENNDLTVSIQKANDQLHAKEGDIVLSPGAGISGVEPVTIHVTQEIAFEWGDVTHETVDDGEKITFKSASNVFTFKSTVRQCHVKIEFAEIHLGKTKLRFDFSSSKTGDQTNWRTFLNSDFSKDKGGAPDASKSQCGGSLSWFQHRFDMAADPTQKFDATMMGDLQGVELDLKENPGNYNVKVDLHLTDKEVSISGTSNKTSSTPDTYDFNFSFMTELTTAGEYVVIKSITVTPYEE